MVLIRDEAGAEAPARETLLDRAFGPARFEKTSERLREGRLPAEGLSLVAVDGEEVVGTVRLWHVTAGPSRPALLLGPLAVDAAYRREGIGSRLMDVAIARAAERGHGAVLLVGDAPYYARFGFSAPPTGRLWLPGPYEAQRFLALELREGWLSQAAGLVNPTGAIALPKRPDFRTLVAGADRHAA